MPFTHSAVAAELQQLLNNGAPFSKIEERLLTLSSLNVEVWDVLPFTHQEHLYYALVGEIAARDDWVECGMDGMRLAWLTGLRDSLARHLLANGPRDEVRDEHYYWMKFGGCSR